MCERAAPFFRAEEDRLAEVVANRLSMKKSIARNISIIPSTWCSEKIYPLSANSAAAIVL